MISHLRPVHAADGADKLVSHRAYWQHVVLHRQVDISRSDKTPRPLAALIAVLHGAHNGVLGLERGAAARAEVAEHASGGQQPFGLMVCLGVVVVIVEQLVLPRHFIIKVGNDGEHLHLKEDGFGPSALELHVKAAPVVLPCLSPTPAEAEALEVNVKPLGQVIALAAHEVYLVVGNDDILERGYLLFKLTRKARRINRAVPVSERIFYLRTRKIVYYGAAHGKLVKVVVGEVGYDLSHSRMFFHRHAHAFKKHVSHRQR